MGGWEDGVVKGGVGVFWYGFFYAVLWVLGKGVNLYFVGKFLGLGGWFVGGMGAFGMMGMTGEDVFDLFRLVLLGFLILFLFLKEKWMGKSE